MALTLAGAVFASSVSAAAADEKIAEATIYKPGQQSPTAVGAVYLSAIEANPACQPYVPSPDSTFQITGPAGSQPIGVTPTTWTLYEILRCALGQTLSAGDWVEVQNPNTGVIEAPLFYAADGGLSDLLTPSDFEDRTQVPLVIVDGSGGQLEYYRPARPSAAGSPADENAADYFAGSEPISISVDEGGSPPLSVAITQTPSSGVAAGTAVTLTAALSPQQGIGAPNPANLSYSWSAPDAGTSLSAAGGASVQATFAGQGVYAVTVEVTDNADGTFGAQTVRISVGAAASTATGAPSASNGQNPQPAAPATGPRQSSGTAGGATARTPHGHKGGGSGKHTGTGTVAPANSKPEPKARPESVSARQTATAEPAAGQAARTSPPAATTRAPSDASTSTTAPGAGPRASDHRTAGHRPHTPVRRPTKLTAPSISAGSASRPPLVAGALIGDVAVLPADASPLVRELSGPASEAAPVRRGTSSALLPALLAALLVILLLSLGAGRELRWRDGWGVSRFGS